jgi:hypothetical protein
VGASRFWPGESWLGLFLADELGRALLDSLITRAGTLDLALEGAGSDREIASQWLVGANLYIGRKFVSESSLRHSRSTLNVNLAANNILGAIPVRGTLNFWEYVGSLRYNLAVESVQPFVKLGYGLSWYRLEEVTFDGNQLGAGEGDWVRKPALFDNLLPNTWHLGAGLEYLPVSSVGGLDFAVKADAAVHTHNLGIQPETGELSFVQETRIYRWVLALAGALTF